MNAKKRELGALIYTDGTPAPARVPVPKKFGAQHYDRQHFRDDARYAAIANSDLFPSAIAGALRKLGIGAAIRLDNLPPGVTVDTSGFLAVVTIEI